MKGLFGIWIALLLGVAGAFCNWFYLAQESRRFEKVDFIAVGDNPINAGDKFTKSSFHRLSIPALNAGQLEKTAVKYEAIDSVVGLTATRSLLPNQVLLTQDLVQPPPPDLKQNLGPDELAMFVPLDTRAVVPSLLKAGDFVSFIVPGPPKAPTPAASPAEAPAATPPRYRVIGPYRILAMGNRFGAADRQKAAGGGTIQESMMSVAVTVKDGRLDKKGEELEEVRASTNFQNVQVLLHNDPQKR